MLRKKAEAIAKKYTILFGVIARASDIRFICLWNSLKAVNFLHLREAKQLFMYVSQQPVQVKHTYLDHY